jgi:hypothetical protein
MEIKTIFKEMENIKIENLDLHDVIVQKLHLVSINTLKVNHGKYLLKVYSIEIFY